jgi:hypothetical protein
MMAKLTKEEQDLLDELTQRASEPDADDYEVPIWNGDKGVTLPLSKAAAWIHENFGIGDAPAGDQSDAGDPPAAKKDPKPPARPGYFGKAG